MVDTTYKIHFQKASVNDVGFLLLLRKLSMTEHLNNAGIFMTDEQHSIRVYEHFEDSSLIMLNAQPVGVIKLGSLDESLHIRQLQLLPKYQGKGIGGAVLNLIKKKALQHNKPITLSVLLQNPAQHLYIRHGFEVINQDNLQYYMRCRLPQCKVSD